MVAVQKSGAAIMARKRKTMVAAISGGVDSAVAAALAAYPDVVDAAVFMSNWTTTSGDNDQSTAVCHEQDERDARQVVAHLGIPVLRRLNFAAEYWVQVFEPYVTAWYKLGETGNPDVSCNRHIKFGALKDQLDKIYAPGEYTLITGHYARLWRRENRNGGGPNSNSSGDSSSCNNDDDPEVPVSVQGSCSSVEIDWLRQWMAPADNDSRAVDNLLLQAADTTKDQSYFLSTCQAPALTNVHFPIGDFLSKTAVRAEAARLGLPNAHKPDSVGLCFVPERNRKNNHHHHMTMPSRTTAFRTFLSEYLPVVPTRPIQFVDVDSHQVVGQTDHYAHAHLYTRGQGAKLSGTAQKYFCVSTNATSNTVTVCRGTHHPALYSQTLRVESIVWWTGRPPPPLLANGSSVVADRSSSSLLRVLCRTRHLVPLVPATIVDHHTVRFDAPVRAVTPGQYAVFYVGVVCLGGGKIVAYE